MFQQGQKARFAPFRIANGRKGNLKQDGKAHAVERISDHEPAALNFSQPALRADSPQYLVPPFLFLLSLLGRVHGNVQIQPQLRRVIFQRRFLFPGVVQCVGKQVWAGRGPFRRARCQACKGFHLRQKDRIQHLSRRYAQTLPRQWNPAVLAHGKSVKLTHKICHLAPFLGAAPGVIRAKRGSVSNFALCGIYPIQLHKLVKPSVKVVVQQLVGAQHKAVAFIIESLHVPPPLHQRRNGVLGIGRGFKQLRPRIRLPLGLPGPADHSHRQIHIRKNPIQGIISQTAAVVRIGPVSHQTHVIMALQRVPGTLGKGMRFHAPQEIISSRMRRNRRMNSVVRQIFQIHRPFLRQGIAHAPQKFSPFCGIHQQGADALLPGQCRVVFANLPKIPQSQISLPGKIAEFALITAFPQGKIAMKRLLVKAFILVQAALRAVLEGNQHFLTASLLRPKIHRRNLTFAKFLFHLLPQHSGRGYAVANQIDGI